MKESLRDVADTAMKSVKTKDKDIFLDIACNDGTLLNYVHGNMIKVGIDPSNVAKVNNGTLVNDYFSARAYYGVAHKGGHLPQAKIITCIAMFYDLDDPRDFLRDVRKVLRDDGIFVVQMSYTPLMFKQVAFDNMCAEHVCYYDLQSLEYVLKAAGFKVVDCTLNDVNGGSFRVTCMKDNADVKHFKSQTERDVANLRVEALREYESGNVGKEATTFGNKIWGLRKDVTNFIFHATQRECKTVYAYGASTKGNTLLQYFGLTNITITAAVERNPDKVGLKTVGTEIPIISEEQMRENPPDYLLLLPWHFIREFEEREAEFLKNGGKFIVPCPEFEIVEYNG
jgi:SAM-dependent methyltransferase